MPKNPAAEPRLVWGIVISAVLHLMLITVMVGVPSWYKPERTYFSTAYRVSLVELPGGKPGGGAQGAAGDSGPRMTAVREVPQKQPAPAPVKKEAVEKPAAETKKAGVTITDKEPKKAAVASKQPKAKAGDAEKAYSQALSRIRDRVGEERRDEELARIRERLAGGGSGGAAGEGAGAGEGPGAGGGGGIGPGGGRIANLPLNYRLYYQAIEQKIKGNWNLALPRGILEDMRGMEVVIGITIAAAGEITDVTFEQKTGNIYLDDSAFRAVKKSSPLPPFEDYNIREASFETGIVFPVGELLE